MRKQLAGLVSVIALCPVLAGCSPPVECPAIGWTNSVTVALEGDVHSVDLVELCAGGMCSRPRGSQPTVENTIPYIASAKSNTVWTITIGMRAPKTVSVRAFSSDGRVLAQKKVNLDWRRVGGTERCGGPEEADPIRLRVNP